uniref:Matrin-type domain-containing protein n=1 Tax=Elaeophora elaphi TaxID=1147741 RepID=A0A0R3RZJ0_9BILA
MSVYDPTSSASVDHRRKWDREEYERKAQERLLAEKDEEVKGKRKLPRFPDEPKVKRELLKAREYKVDLESKVGRTVVINKTTPSAETGGYYCDVCDCVVKDSINFLDHINGKNHQRNMGMSMKIKRSTLDEVRQRFAFKKAQKEMQKKESDMHDRLDDLKEEEARMADYKKSKRLEQKKRKYPEVQVDEEIAAAMGFGGFGTTKKS